MMQELILKYDTFFWGILCVLAICIFFCLFRACIGPTVADRLVAINMMSTMVMVMVCLLAVIMQEGYLVDISILYAMVSFLAVILLTKVVLGLKIKADTAKQLEITTDDKEGE